MFKTSPLPSLRRPLDQALLTLLALLALLVPVEPAAAQPAGTAWRTLVVGDGAFRVHYQAATEAWTRRAAGHLVVIRNRLAEEIGYRPEQTIDVVVADPLSRPNGSAWALLGAPRIVLWTTPPEPTSVLGTYRDWGELVATHEEAHLVHLLRPSRSPWRRLAGRLLPLGGPGPIGLEAPRWVTEGYATLLEGRLTGAGRPNSDLAAAVLRERALAGRLPSYGALGGDDHTWLGRSMAYLGGSSYLAWLEQRTGPRSLKDLWARMTARKKRSFDEAFRGVFGDGPAALYGRFTAELTWRAVESRRALDQEGSTAGGGRAHNGALWLERGWRTGAPAVSLDGQRLAVVLRDRKTPPRLAVLATADDPDAAREREEAAARLLARDPEDVPAVPPAAPPRTPLAVLPTVDGRAPAKPRWLADGRSLLYTAAAPDAAGILHFDLYRWTPRLPVSADAEGAGAQPTRDPDTHQGTPVRITDRADLRSPDPVPAATPGLPGGSAWAVAVRNRHGESQLVRVDLVTGAVSALTEPSVDTVWATPRIAPDGRRLAVVRHQDGRWELVLFALDWAPDEAAPPATSLRRLAVLPTPGTLVADPAWSPDGRTLYAAVGEAESLAEGSAETPAEYGGSVDLVAFDLGNAPASPALRTRGLTRTLTRTLTRSGGAALAPAPAPDGRSLFFLGLTDRGLDVRRLVLPPKAGAAGESNGTGTLSGADGPAAAPTQATGADRTDEEIPRATPPEGPPLGAVGAIAPDALPPDRPYRFGPREHAPLVGFALSASGSAVEAGVAGTDPVGRLDWIAVGALSSGGAPQGAVSGATFRAPPFATSFHLFTADLAPSAQGHARGRAPAATEGGLDVTRRGIAAEQEWRRRFAPLTLRLGVGLVAGQVAGQVRRDGPPRTETLGTAWSRLDGNLALTPSRGLWQGLLGLGARFEGGETDGAAWSRDRETLATGLFRDGQGARLTWIRHGSNDLRFPFDRYQVGGVRRSILPALADGTRVAVPALTEGTLVGDAVETQRVELIGLWGGLLPGPLPEDTRLFWERHRAWNAGTPRGDWLTLAGIELTRTLAPVPLLGLPGVHVSAGAAYLLDTPDPSTEGDVRLWAAIGWQP